MDTDIRANVGTDMPLSAAPGGVPLCYEDVGIESSHRVAPVDLEADSTNFRRKPSCSPKFA